MASKGTVWLVSQYEPAPGGGWRPLRSHYLARCLVARGYTVVQWSATFRHQGYTFVAKPWEEREVEPGWTVRHVPNTAYRRNVGAKRLMSEARFADNFRRRAKAEPRPACIVVREPPRVLGEAALKVGHVCGAPVVSDVIDLWPEFFHRVLPARARSAGRALFARQYARRRRYWSKVDGLVGVSEAYVAHAKSVTDHLERVPTACVYTSIEFAFVQERLRASTAAADRLGPKPVGEIWVGYAGTLGLAYDIPVVLRAMEILRERRAPVRLVVAGIGPFVPTMKAASALPDANVAFLGQLAPDDLYAMLGRCDVGLLSYAGDTTVAIPDKFYDYAAAGLPVVSSLQGEARDLIERWGFGVTYAPGSAEALIQAIERLAGDGTLRETMGDRAEAAARSWDAPTHFERFADLIEEVIRHHAQRVGRDDVPTT